MFVLKRGVYLFVRKGGDIMKILHIITFLLVVIGALNWGLIGIFNFNLVNAILGSLPNFERAVYAIVGLSAVYTLVMHPKECKTCTMK